MSVLIYLGSFSASLAIVLILDILSYRLFKDNADKMGLIIAVVALTMLIVSYWEGKI